MDSGGAVVKRHYNILSKPYSKGCSTSSPCHGNVVTSGNDGKTHYDVRKPEGVMSCLKGHHTVMKWKCNVDTLKK